MEIKVLKNVMMKNNAIGGDNRWRLKQSKVFSLNMVSSPGAGKTTLLKHTLGRLTRNHKVAVIEGDLYTSKDALALEQFDIPLIQINTEGGCHLDARMISTAMDNIDLESTEILFIENVGNLVCPASFDLGEDKMVLLYPITEGDDKPSKYATMFQKADLVIINKVDIAPYLNVSPEKAAEEVRKINPDCEILTLSATKMETLDGWFEWIEKEFSLKSQE
ncbi:MAG: hydrogenase nickel incorporation protein HypB [Deltaproteobacteria bacterium]|nr:hydrogenase nickel incorporation protein HypB [Deltaproteobacteria bacterium]